MATPRGAWESEMLFDRRSGKAMALGNPHRIVKIGKIHGATFIILCFWYDKGMRLSKLSPLFFAALLLTLSCAKKPTLATLRASVNSNGASSVVNVLFNTYTATFVSNTALVTFSDGGGNSMTLTLRGSSDDLSTESYTVDGVQNVLEAELVITTNLEPQVVSVKGTSGFINVTSANVSGATVTGFSGDFNVNFDSGGSGFGTYNTND